MSWIDIAALDDIPLRGARVLKTAAGCVAVFRPTENEAYALSDRCPHKGGPLCEGRTAGFMKCDRPGAPYEYLRKGEIVRCPWHGWEYDLKSGQSWVDPASVRVRSYDVGIESTEPADIEIDPDTGYAKGPFLAETYPVSIDKLNVVLDLP